MENENSYLQRRRRNADDAPRDPFIRLRNWLNLVALYFFSDHTVGTIVILAAMVFKIVECALRFLH